ncbi:MAG: PorV/PorQ family protein [Chitinispirillales bacterium]|jgi:ligand-binding sensor domain-containing protein|nr:PorV/PorQ family protein [Chitinispirillales bacterium]
MEIYSFTPKSGRGKQVTKYRKNGCFTVGKAAAAACFCLVLLSVNAYAIGQSAVVTLSFPVGARPTAMGEAFTALANDANATFYNPAGLGQSPLSSSWKTHFGDSAFTAVAARSSAEFGSRNYVWAGTFGGVTRFNGKIWEKGEVFLVEGDESIRAIAQRYFVSDDKTIIDNAVWEILKANKLGMKRYEQLVILLEPQKDVLKNDSAKFTPETFAKMIMLLPDDELDGDHLEKQILPKAIDAKAKKELAGNIVKAVNIDDRTLEQVTELIIPFTAAVRDSVTALAVDEAERLWVGTVSGLWRYHDGKWKLYTAASDGLPSDRITSVGIASDGNLAVGTEQGLAVLSNVEWSSFTKKNGLPDSYITAVAFSKKGELYIGTPNGLAKKEGDGFTVFDTSSGLLSQRVGALFADSKEQLWIGGENGVTIHSGARNWKRYRFPGSTIYSFGEQANGTIWIGSNKGVITYKSGKTTVDKDGRSVDKPEWKTYHSKNALKNDNARAIAACSKDMWIATDGALHQYDYASTQVLLFYEQLLPVFKFSDLWHAYPSVIIPTEEWGTIGFFVNFINMGNNDRWDELENYLGQARSWEGVFGVSYGLPIKENLSLGLSAKYIHSVLDEASGGVGQTFAVDAGILKRNFLIDKFDIGFMLQNMGPKIYYITPEEADPIPFSLRLGMAYKPVQTPFHELTLVMDAYREVVKTYVDKAPDPFWKALWTGFLNDKNSSFKEQVQEINISMGLEYMYADFMALRSGLLADYLGERFELSLGLGVKYANINFDFSYIYAPPGFMGGLVSLFNKDKDGASGARDGQWRLSFLFNL